MSVENDVKPTEPAPQEVPPVRTGDDGVLPGPGGVLTVLKGAVPQRVTARGVASGGTALEFQFTIPAQAR